MDRELPPLPALLLPAHLPPSPPRLPADHPFASPYRSPSAASADGHARAGLAYTWSEPPTPPASPTHERRHRAPPAPLQLGRAAHVWTSTPPPALRSAPLSAPPTQTRFHSLGHASGHVSGHASGPHEHQPTSVRADTPRGWPDDRYEPRPTAYCPSETHAQSQADVWQTIRQGQPAREAEQIGGRRQTLLGRLRLSGLARRKRPRLPLPIGVVVEVKEEWEDAWDTASLVSARGAQARAWA